MIISLFHTCILSVISASALALSGNQHGGPHHHAEVVRHSGNQNFTARDDYQYSNIRATWYGAGLGACGATYAPSDFIVALAQDTFGWSYPSPYCNRPIVISYNGRTANAKIVDSCVACSSYDPHALDLTEGLFSHFANEGEGVIYVDWSFADAIHHSTSTHTTTSSRHHTSHTSSSSYTTSTRTTSTQTSSSAAPTGTSAPADNGNLYNLNEFVLNLEHLLQAAAA